MMGDVFLTVPRCFSCLFASAHVIGLRLGINQSATALDGVSEAPGKHMLHMCRKSLVINLFFLQISGFYPFELRWVSKMFVHCIKPSSSIMYNLWKWSDGRRRKSCIDRRAQHGRHVPTLVGQCGIDKYVTYLREISIEHDVRRYKRIFFNIWPIGVWCQPQMSTLFGFGKSRIGIRSKRHHQILNDHSPKGPLIAILNDHSPKGPLITRDLNRYVTEVTSINEHHSFFKMPISTEQFQSLLHCKCEANPNTNTLISGPTRATFNFIRKTKCWRAWHHVNWTSSACIFLHHYQIITTWILWGHYVRQLIL